MGAHPRLLPGGLSADDAAGRGRFEAAWMARWGDRPTTSNGLLPVSSLNSAPGLGIADLPAAIEAGRVKAMVIGNTIGGRFTHLDARLAAALSQLDFLVVADSYADTPLGELADAILPLAMSMEKDGTFTSYDRTVQRLRSAVPPMGEAKGGVEICSLLARRMGYNMDYRTPARVMDEIATLVPGYGGISYARLERHGITVPTASYMDPGAALLAVGAPLAVELTPAPAMS
jgi:predicted molibdopterin-dependent oxidoreductase YjgC